MQPLPCSRPRPEHWLSEFVALRTFTGSPEGPTSRAVQFPQNLRPVARRNTGPRALSQLPVPVRLTLSSSRVLDIRSGNICSCFETTRVPVLPEKLTGPI